MSKNATTTASSPTQDKLDKPLPPSRYIRTIVERYGALKAVTYCSLDGLGRPDLIEAPRGVFPMSYHVAETFFALFQDLEEAERRILAWEELNHVL